MVVNLEAARAPRIGFIGPTARDSPFARAFTQGLTDLGYVEGHSIVIERRFGEARAERFPEVAAEIVGLDVDVIAVVGAVTARAVARATATIATAFAVVVDPVSDGLLANPERPGANVTGVTSFDSEQPRRQLEILKEALPHLKRVALLGDKGVSEFLLNANTEQAWALGLVPQRLRLTAADRDVASVFAEILREQPDALVALEEPAIVMHRKRIAALASKNRLPTLFARDWADAGGSFAYGTSVLEAVYRMAAYVDKILKGANPGELPVRVVTGHRLIINTKTTREIGVTVPPGLLKRADAIVTETGELQMPTEAP